MDLQQSDILHDKKFECKMLKIHIATVKNLIILSYGVNTNDCKDFRLRWLSLLILVKAEQNHFKMLVTCIFIQTAIKGSFEVNGMYYNLWKAEWKNDLSLYGMMGMKALETSLQF